MSLTFLHRADYMRRYDIRSVQTIAVLGICFNNMGDCNLYETLWPCAIRIAENLGMHQHPNSVRPELDREWCRRLWWTLIICEWLHVPSRPPCIVPDSFCLPLPSVDELNRDPDIDSVRTVDPIDRDVEAISVHYHTVLVRIALTHRQFHAATMTTAVLDDDHLIAIVRSADGALADIIATLPPALRPDAQLLGSNVEGGNVDGGSFDSSGLGLGLGSSSVDANVVEHPRVCWQRWHVTLVLLFFRLVINRSLQSSWVASSSPALRGPRAICLDAARGIIRISQQSEQPMGRRTRWYAFGTLLSLLCFFF